MSRAAFVATLLLALSAAPLHAQRARSQRATGARKGIPCGHSYIAANKVCHIGTAAPDTSADSAAHAMLRRPIDGLEDYVTVRRERDSLRSVLDSIRHLLGIRVR